MVAFRYDWAPISVGESRTEVFEFQDDFGDPLDVASEGVWLAEIRSERRPRGATVMSPAIDVDVNEVTIVLSESQVEELSVESRNRYVWELRRDLDGDMSLVGEGYVTVREGVTA